MLFHKSKKTGEPKTGSPICYRLSDGIIYYGVYMSDKKIYTGKRVDSFSQVKQWQYANESLVFFSDKL